MTYRASLIVLLGLAWSLPIAAQDPPADPAKAVTEVHDIRDFRTPIRNLRGPLLGFPLPEAVKSPEAGDSVINNNVLEIMPDLIQQFVRADWGQTETLEMTAQGMLVVHCDPDKQAEIREFIARLRAIFLPEITVDAFAVEMPSPMLQDVVAASEGGVVADEKLAKLQEWIKAGGEVKIVQRFRICVRPDQIKTSSRVDETKYVADIDRLGGESGALSTRIQTLKTGESLEIHVSLFERYMNLHFQYTAASTDGAVETLEVSKGMRLQLPSIRVRRLAGHVSCLNTATVFVGCMPAPGKPGFDRALFLRPQRETKGVEIKARRAADGTQVELLNISALTPSPEFPASNDVQVATGEGLSELIKNSMPDKWDEGAGHLLCNLGGALIARNTPESLKDVQDLLTKQAEAALVPLKAEFALVSATQEAIGASGFGESLTGHAAEKLLERATAGQNAALLWHGTGFILNASPLIMEDLRQRSIVTGYISEKDVHDPEVGIAEWGVKVRVAATFNAKEGTVHFQDAALEFSTSTEPFEKMTVDGDAKLPVHLPKRSVHAFESHSTIEPGTWVSMGANPGEKETFVLLARVTKGKLSK